MQTLQIAVLILNLVAGAGSARTWTDSAGRFSVEAELLAVRDGNVQLRRPDGSMVTVPVAKLSELDQRYLASLKNVDGAASTPVSKSEEAAGQPSQRESPAAARKRKTVRRDMPRATEPTVAAAENDRWLNVRDCGASGSAFETTTKTTAGSKQIRVASVGDFKAGQGVTVSKCNVRYTRMQRSGSGLSWFNRKPLGNSVEVRGYDGSGGSWVVYILDIAPGKREFRWTDDLGRHWHPAVAITHDWQPLSCGVEVRLNQLDWESGYVFTFSVRDQLLTTIEKIGGNVLTLRGAANRSANDAVVRHNDTSALQAAIDRAVKEKRNLFVPNGHYRLAYGVMVRNAAAITVEGQSAVDTLLDVSDGEGACIRVLGGTEVTIRNFRMIGCMGFDEADKAESIRTKGSSAIWGEELKSCSAVNINDGTERVLVENCHASRMSCECFQSHSGIYREMVKPGQSHTKAITYLRCSVTDCARNGFDDLTCATENTSILYCRVVDVGGCTWEGLSRFGKFIGNYVRNSGPVVCRCDTMTAGKAKPYPDLGSAQHVIADNVFEGGESYGGRFGSHAAIYINGGTSQVIVRNNRFINYNSPAVQASGWTEPGHSISTNTTIVGNIVDLTCVDSKAVPRTGIDVSSDDVIVSDNQIYVRGQCEPLVTAIRLKEPALNLIVHDNLVRNCGVGIATERGQARVGEVVDSQTFVRNPWTYGLPIERRRIERTGPEQYRGWQLAWQSGGKPQTLSIIDSFDPETLRFKLREPHPMQVHDLFDVIVPSLNWNIHDNTVAGCQHPVVLDSHGSDTACFRNNLIERGGAADATQAIEMRGHFRLIDNQIVGFDEKKTPSGKGAGNRQ